MIYRRNKVADGTIKMSDTEEYSLQNKTGTINITTVNVDKIRFKNLLIVSASLKRQRPSDSVSFWQDRKRQTDFTYSKEFENNVTGKRNRKIESEK